MRDDPSSPTPEAEDEFDRLVLCHHLSFLAGQISEMRGFHENWRKHARQVLSEASAVIALWGEERSQNKARDGS